ncbi:hypothetical protein [Cetobacterium sp.]|uniref:hypothetical protein n=1 Tax=Cetobacterium sp. TaxID=2071632 RepID=UPI003EE6A057
MFKFIKYRKDIRRLKFLYNQIFSLNMLRRGAKTDIGETLLEDLKQYEKEYEKLKNRLVSKFFL